ncbi:MAG: YlqD family protein [Bacillota bacterium]
MDQITVTRPVILKVRLTENYKKELLEKLAAAIAEADREVQRAEFQAKRVQAEKKARPAPAAAEDTERMRRENADARERLRNQYETIKDLPPGTEIIQGRTESLVEIHIGDDARRLNPVEVVIEEDKIVALREQG